MRSYRTPFVSDFHYSRLQIPTTTVPAVTCLTRSGPCPGSNYSARCCVHFILKYPPYPTDHTARSRAFFLILSFLWPFRAVQSLVSKSYHLTVLRALIRLTDQSTTRSYLTPRRYHTPTPGIFLLARYIRTRLEHAENHEDFHGSYASLVLGQPALTRSRLFSPSAQLALRWLVLWEAMDCLLYTSPSPRDGLLSRMPSSA